MSKELEPNEKTNLVLKVGSKVPFSGLICALLAGVSFTTGKLLVKQANTVHPTVNITIRGFISMIFYGLIISFKRLPITGDNKKQFFCLCGRGFFGFLVSITSYTALWCIPLGDSITLLLTATVFTSVFARIFINEKFTFLNIFCIGLTMVGVVFIAEPPILGFKLEEDVEYKNKYIGITLSLIAAISFAFSYVILRYLKGVHVDLIVTYFGIFTFFGTLVCLPFIKAFGDHPEKVKIPENMVEWTYSMAISFAGILGEFFLTSAFQLENANYIAILRCGDILMAFLAENIFLPKEFSSTHWNIYVGAGIILFTVLITTICKVSKEKEPEEKSIRKEEISNYPYQKNLQQNHQKNIEKCS